MASPVEVGLVVDDLARFDDDDRHKYELIGGELFMSPRGRPPHQYAASRLVHRFMDWADAHGGAAFGEQDVYYSERDYVIPDVVLLSASTLARSDDERAIDVPPDLIVEVSSPSTRSLDLVRKRALYERQGVPAYWFVDLDERCVEVYRLTEGGRYPAPVRAGSGQTLRPPHLPGLAVEVGDIVRPLR